MELQERFAEFRMGESYPDTLILEGETTIAGSHVWIGLREDGELEIRNIGAGQILFQSPDKGEAQQLGYDPEHLPSGSLFVVGENLEYRILILRE